MQSVLPIRKSKAEIEFYQEYCPLFGDVLYSLYTQLKDGKVKQPIDLISLYYDAFSGHSNDTLKNVFRRGYPFVKQKNHLEHWFDYPICVSVNDVIAHGQPIDGTRFKVGDIVSVDCGLSLRDERTSDLLNFDAAFTVVYSQEEQPDWVLAPRQALCNIIDTQAKNTYDTAIEIFKTAREYNLYTVTQLTGHGIGHNLHEEPLVRNAPGMYSNTDFFEGLVFCAEPIYVLPSGTADGSRVEKVHIDSDGWSIKTNSGQPGSHFETMFCFSDKKLVDLCNITKWLC